MKSTAILLIVFTCATSSLNADSRRQEFVKSWKGQLVVVKTTLYSLLFNERGMLGNTRGGRREGLLVVTSATSEHLQFDGRQGRETVVATSPALLVKAVANAYERDALEVRSYRKVDPLAVELFAPGSDLVVSDVRVERDLITLQFEEPGGVEGTMTSLRLKWPVPLSASFSEREHLETLLRRYIDIRRP